MASQEMKHMKKQITLSELFDFNTKQKIRQNPTQYTLIDGNKKMYQPPIGVHKSQREAEGFSSQSLSQNTSYDGLSQEDSQNIYSSMFSRTNVSREPVSSQAEGKAQVIDRSSDKKYQNEKANNHYAVLQTAHLKRIADGIQRVDATEKQNKDLLSHILKGIEKLVNAACLMIDMHENASTGATLQQPSSPPLDQEEFIQKIAAIFPVAALTTTLQELQESLTTQVSNTAVDLDDAIPSPTFEVAPPGSFSDDISYGEDIAATLIANAKSKKRRRR